MEVFNSTKTNVQSWSAAGAVITWSLGKSGEASTMPFIAQQVSWSFQRTSFPIQPVNTDQNGNRMKILVYGDAIGQLTIQSVISPVYRDIGAFLKAVQNPCVNPNTSVSVRIEPFAGLACTSDNNDQPIGNSPKFDMYGVTLDAISGSIQGGQMALVSMPLQLSYTGLDIDFGN